MVARILRLPPGGRLSVSLIITQIGRENNISAEIYVSRTVEDAGLGRTVEDACPYKTGTNFLMRSTLKRLVLLLFIKTPTKISVIYHISRHSAINADILSRNKSRHIRTKIEYHIGNIKRISNSA